MSAHRVGAMLRIILLVVLWMAAFSASSAIAERRVALVVGNGDYGALGRLANPVNDARAMKKLLEDELGFEVFMSLDADTSALQAALTAFGRAAKEADVALFFYSGHGVELEGANYMLPVSADIQSDVDLLSQGYRLDRVVELMVRAGAKIKIVLVDACRNNPLPSVATKGARGLQPLYATNVDTLIAFATEPGKVAYDGDGSNSPFTEGLIAYLGKPDLALDSTLRRVRNAVYSATRKKQFPWWDDMFLTDVYLGGRNATLQATASPLASLPLADDLALCEQIGASSSPLILESYLDRYPNGFCAAAVRKRLAAAQPPGEPAPAAAAADELPPPPPAPAPEPASAGEPDPEDPPVSGGAAAPMPVEPAAASAGAYSVSSYWNHNGSLVALSAQGTSRVFYYERPRALMEEAGVVRGTLLFKGQFAGRSYKGQAYQFSSKCGPIAYPVKGEVSADFTRIDLAGERPVRDSNCRRTGTKVDRLVFEYRSKSL